jgi:hypothetical protein
MPKNNSINNLVYATAQSQRIGITLTARATRRHLCRHLRQLPTSSLGTPRCAMGISPTGSPLQPNWPMRRLRNRNFTRSPCIRNGGFMTEADGTAAEYEVAKSQTERNQNGSKDAVAWVGKANPDVRCSTKSICISLLPNLQ